MWFMFFFFGEMQCGLCDWDTRIYMHIYIAGHLPSSELIPRDNEYKQLYSHMQSQWSALKKKKFVVQFYFILLWHIYSTIPLAQMLNHDPTL